MLFFVYIYGDTGKDIKGRLTAPHFGWETEFGNLGEMVCRMDELCDRMEVLKRDEPEHFFQAEDEQQYQKLILDDQGAFRKTSGEELESEKEQENCGCQAAALLQVQLMSRKAHTIQGIVRSSRNGNLPVGFRSGLELMRMIALQQMPAEKQTED